ncbi:unnamed protein product, partial [Bubo scandiacus]
MALTAETESRLYRSLRAAAGAAAHLVALGFPTAVAVLARPGSSLFSWHPLLMALAFSFLMTEALLIFSPETSLLRSFSRKVKVRAHWALQLLALLCALLGLGIITYNKHLNGKAHFVTWHGLTGLLTVLYASGQCAGGGAPALPQADEELDAGQAQAVPCDLGAGGLPAGLCQPDAGHVLPVVHRLGDQRLVVPCHAVSPSHQPGYHEPGEQRLPVPQAEPAL